MKKRLLWIAAALVLLSGALACWRYRVMHAPPEVTYKTAPVEKRHIVGRVTASGTLSAIVTVQVGTQVSGRIQKLYANYNSHVKKGDLVAKIDPQLFEASVQQAQANYLQAKAGVATAEASALNADKQYARTRALHDQNLAAQADLDTAEANVATTHAAIDAAKAQLAQAAAQLHTAQVNLSYTNIISPIDGVVISRSVDVGQTVAASLSAPTLFTIAQDLTKMQVDTNVAEGDVGRLQVDMKTYFTVDSFPGQRFRGTIREIRNAATAVQNVVTYDAVIDVDNTDLRLRPGMTANVTIIYDERRDALAVPNAALRFRPPPALAGSGSAGGAHRRGRGASPGGGEGQAAAMPSTAAAAPSEGASSEGRERRPVEGKNAEGPEGRPPESKTVWVMRGGLVPQEAPIHVGLSDGTVTEVLDGDLHDGDAVVVDSTSADGTSSPGPGPGGGPGAGPGSGGGGMRRLF
jgi:HlyD family secretion protein